VNATDPTSDVSASLVPHVLPSVAWAEVDGETVAYDEVRKRVHVLSPTATLVWSGIDGRTSLEQIARDLSRSFGEALPVVRSDVVELARDLIERGLIAGNGAVGRSGSEVAVSEVVQPHVARATTPRFLEDPPKG
jgi:Coenzyme PQQ synthesis protein D (PqqD)